MIVRKLAVGAGAVVLASAVLAAGLVAIDRAQAQTAASGYQFMSTAANTVWVLNPATGSVALCTADAYSTTCTKAVAPRQ